MNPQAPTDPSDIPIASDLDQEVRLLAHRTGVEPDEARRLIEDAGSFAAAMKQLGYDLEVKPSE